MFTVLWESQFTCLPGAGLEAAETPNPDAATPLPPLVKLPAPNPLLGDPNPDENDPLPNVGLLSVYIPKEMNNLISLISFKVTLVLNSTLTDPCRAF